MQYVIMFILVVGASIADVLTGLIKAHITTGYNSTIMKNGLYNKVLEWLVMGVVIGLEIGLGLLIQYYNAPEITSIAGAVPSVFVFAYILLMELISIFENFAEANPDAPLAKIMVEKLQKLNYHNNAGNSQKEKEKKDNEDNR